MFTAQLSVFMIRWWLIGTEPHTRAHTHAHTIFFSLLPKWREQTSAAFPALLPGQSWDAHGRCLFSSTDKIDSHFRKSSLFQQLRKQQTLQHVLTNTLWPALYTSTGLTICCSHFSLLWPHLLYILHCPPSYSGSTCMVLTSVNLLPIYWLIWQCCSPFYLVTGS